MNDLFAADSDTNGSEPLDEGGNWLLDCGRSTTSAAATAQASPSGMRSPRQSIG